MILFFAPQEGEGGKAQLKLSRKTDADTITKGDLGSAGVFTLKLYASTDLYSLKRAGLDAQTS